MSRTELQLERLTCPTSIKKIEDTLKKMEGVIDAKVLFNSNKVKVGFDETVVQTEDISDRIENIGYEVLS